MDPGVLVLSQELFFSISIFDLKYFFSPLTYKNVPHLKDLIHISLQPEAQGCGMTSNM